MFAGIVRSTTIALVVATASAIALTAQQRPGTTTRALTAADYAHAERFMSWNTTPLVFRNGVSPTCASSTGPNTGRGRGGRGAAAVITSTSPDGKRAVFIRD